MDLFSQNNYYHTGLLQLFPTRKCKLPPNWFHLLSTKKLISIPMDPRSGPLAFVQSVLREDYLEMNQEDAWGKKT